MNDRVTRPQTRNHEIRYGPWISLFLAEKILHENIEKLYKAMKNNGGLWRIRKIN